MQLGEPHNKAKVKQADRIIVLLNLNKSGDDYLRQATAYWGDYIIGSDSYKATYSRLFAYKIEEKVSSQPSFIDSLHGRRLYDKLIRLQDDTRGTKELTFITIRSRNDVGYNPAGRFTVRTNTTKNGMMNSSFTNIKTHFPLVIRPHSEGPGFASERGWYQ